MRGMDTCARLAPLLFLAACGDPDKNDTGPATSETECLEWFWADQDGDGYGNPNNGVTACEAPSGYVSDATDCDDYRAETHPSADETCNGIDDDCDDVEDEDPVDGTSWFVDEDGDGYGSEESTELGCEMPEGAATNSDDCDDDDDLVNPGASETWYDGVDADCAGDDDYDQDADGFQHDGWGGTDCDDSDAGVHPDAFDEPNDGVDADCSGSDPTGTVYEVEAGDELDEELSFDLALMPDLAFVLDSTASFYAIWPGLDLGNLVVYVNAAYDDPSWGLASYQDYPTGGYGMEGSDLAFVLEQAQTTDSDAFEAALAGITIGSGADGPESGMEALYQAYTGAGHDLGCDGRYDSAQDVLPYLADSTDPFGGAGGETYDGSGEGTGTLGGMGFREGAFPIVVLVTDYDLRDPDAGYPVPGGCPLDAGHADVVSAQASLGGFLVGVHFASYSTAPYEQLAALCADVGSVVDTDSDGKPDEVLASQISTINALEDRVSEALDGANAHPFEQVCIEARGDDAGVLTVVEPSCHEGWSIDEGAPEFTLTFEPKTAGVVHELTLEVVADGLHLLASESILVVVPEA